MQDRSSFGEGPTYVILWSINWLVDWIVMRNWFMLFYNMHMIILCWFTNLGFPWDKSVLHLGTLFVSPIHSVILFWIIFIGIHAWLINCHDYFILLVETHFRGLEGCYGLYRTFPISNLTPEPDPVFHRPSFPK